MLFVWTLAVGSAVLSSLALAMLPGGSDSSSRDAYRAVMSFAGAFGTAALIMGVLSRLTGGGPRGGEMVLFAMIACIAIVIWAIMPALA
jgi:hypothetical protein